MVYILLSSTMIFVLYSPMVVETFFLCIEMDKMCTFGLVVKNGNLL